MNIILWADPELYTESRDQNNQWALFLRNLRKRSGDSIIEVAHSLVDIEERIQITKEKLAIIFLAHL